MSVYIIAEAGVNHNGCIERAHELIDVAADAGADAVKFQTFKASEMASASVSKADYQKSCDTANESQHAMLQQLELAHEWHLDLRDHAVHRSIDFLSSAFDVPSLDFLVDTLGLETMKVSSGELTNLPFLYAHACKGVDMIVSTGMSTVSEVEAALSVIACGLLFSRDEIQPPGEDVFRQAFASSSGQAVLREKVSLLHCTSEYPAQLDDVNLRVMHALSQRFDLPVGYSDHTLGTRVASLAVAAGAVVLEKHFTTDNSLPGPDHAMSLAPYELGVYVAEARQTERVLGTREKTPTSGEIENRKIGRKKLTAVKTIRAGEVFTMSNIGLKRVGEIGLEPSEYWSLLGKRAANNIDRDSAITRCAVSQEGKP